jgi:hypothetical protein
LNGVQSDAHTVAALETMAPPLPLLGLLLLPLVSSAQPPTTVDVDVSTDVLVLGATPSGIAAGIAAATGVGARHAVHIFEPLTMLGGMAVAGGVGLMNNEQGVYGQGIGGRWCALNARAYGTNKSNCFPEMHVGEASFKTMLAETPNVTLSLGCRLLGVDRAGACLTAARFLCANDTVAVTATARVFIDASYDGDAMVAAGVSHAHGREAIEVRTLVGQNEQWGRIGLEVGPRIERRLPGGITLFLDGKAEATSTPWQPIGGQSLPGLATDGLGLIGVTGRTGLLR